MGSNDLYFCFDLKACKNCIGCAGLRNAEYCIFNRKYSKEDYEKWKKENMNLRNPAHIVNIKVRLEELMLQVPHKYMVGEKAEDVTGNYIYESKNTHYAFDVKKCEDCSYVAQVVDMKDCYDNNYTEENETCYEYMGSYRNNRVLFSTLNHATSDCFYTHFCVSSQNCFGCVALKHKQFCILNKQYGEAEYFDLVKKLSAHMQQTSLSQERGEHGEPASFMNKEWGEFFPASISPFPYNETVAQDYFPLTKEEALKRGYKWRE